MSKPTRILFYMFAVLAVIAEASSTLAALLGNADVMVHLGVTACFFLLLSLWVHADSDID